MAQFNMNEVEANSYHNALNATRDADVISFSAGHGFDRIHRFDPWADKIDLTGFDQNIPRKELMDCLTWQTVDDPDRFGALVSGFVLDLSK